MSSASFRENVNIIIGFLVLAFSVYGYSATQHDKFVNDEMHREETALRNQLSGYWVYKLTTKTSDLGRYINIELGFLVTMGVDENLSVGGVAYKWREKNSDGEFIYTRSNRARADITGSIFENQRIELRWVMVDKRYGESIVIVNGQVGEGYIIGTFASDVAFQKGDFCAKIIGVGISEDLTYRFLDCSILLP